jgi:hypothetical protein
MNRNFFSRSSKKQEVNHHRRWFRSSDTVQVVFVAVFWVGFTVCLLIYGAKHPSKNANSAQSRIENPSSMRTHVSHAQGAKFY